MKYVLSVFGSLGDVQPVAGLGLALQNAGHEVVLCAPENFDTFSREMGLPFVPVGTDVSELFRRSRLRVDHMTLKLRQELGQHFEALKPHVQDADFVLGAGVPVAAPSVAELFGVPYRFVGYCPLTFPSRFHPPPHFHAFQRLRLLSRALWVLSNGFFNVAGRGVINAFRTQHGLRKISNVWEHVVGESPFLAADATLAPLPHDLESRVFQTGAWSNPRMTSGPLPPEVKAFFSDREPPIFVGFGSMPVEKPQQLHQLIDHLVKSTQRRFILSLPSEWHPQMPPSDDVLLVSRVSHAGLFPKMALVVHHGGAGTTTLAAQAGVPQIIVPHMLDQHYWARRAMELGVAPAPLKKAQLSPWRLQEAIFEASSDRMRQRADGLARLMTHDGVGQALARLEASSGTQEAA